LNKMARVEELSIADHTPELVKAIARPGRNGDPQRVIDSLTDQGANPCDLRRRALLFVSQTGGPTSRLHDDVRDAFAVHDTRSLAAAGADMSPRRG
jgi:hypothetical protein